VGFKKESAGRGNAACLLGEADKFSHGFSLHLLHDPAAVDFYRLEGNALFRANLFTQHPLATSRKTSSSRGDKELTRRLIFAISACFLLSALLFSMASLTASSSFFASDGLGQKIYCAGLHRLTLIGISPWPVIKIMGCEFRAAIAS